MSKSSSIIVRFVLEATNVRHNNLTFCVISALFTSTICQHHKGIVGTSILATLSIILCSVIRRAIFTSSIYFLNLCVSASVLSTKLLIITHRSMVVIALFTSTIIQNPVEFIFACICLTFIHYFIFCL
jgi:hypothetical protein